MVTVHGRWYLGFGANLGLLMTTRIPGSLCRDRRVAPLGPMILPMCLYSKGNVMVGGWSLVSSSVWASAMDEAVPVTVMVGVMLETAMRVDDCAWIAWMVVPLGPMMAPFLVWGQGIVIVMMGSRALCEEAMFGLLAVTCCRMLKKPLHGNYNTT